MTTFIIIVLIIFIIVLLSQKSQLKKKLRQEVLNQVNAQIIKSEKKLDQVKAQIIKSQKDLSLVEEVLKQHDNGDYGLIASGFYEPTFDFDTSEEFKDKITTIVNQQKEHIKNKSAVSIIGIMTSDGSEAKGRVMQNKIVRLALRAFNGEASTFISKVKWNNIDSSITRLEKSTEIINRMIERNGLMINPEYLALKIEELKCTHEYTLKLHEEREEQKEIKAQMREEEKVRREAERIKRKAEEQEKQYNKALLDAEKSLSEAHGEEKSKLEIEIEKLKAKLSEAEENSKRAISMAEQTKRGHVYIISNIGSFGNNVYKIGMTRRLEPLDRVKELGDASVPFAFDVHAMIHTDNAPELEKKLHHQFADNRVNKVNLRKEFFHVSLDEIEASLKNNINHEFKLTKLAEAKEFNETSLITNQKGNN